MGYKQFLKITRELISDFERGKVDFPLTKYLTKETIKHMKKQVRSKKEFVKFYKRLNCVDFDKDVFKAVKIKAEQDKKSIINNPRCKDKEKNIKQIEKYNKSLIRDFKNLLKDKSSWKH